MAVLREVMKTGLHTVTPSTAVGEAVTLMTHHRIGLTLVIDGMKLVGIFTERDTARAISQASDAPAHQVSVWMTPNPTTVAWTRTPTRRCASCSITGSGICRWWKMVPGRNRLDARPGG